MIIILLYVRNAIPSNNKMLLAKTLLMIFKARFHAKGLPLVVLFVCISSNNSYYNMLMHDILNKDNPNKFVYVAVITSRKVVNPCSIVVTFI